MSAELLACIASALLGTLLAVNGKKVDVRILSFAAGIALAIVVLTDLIPESLESLNWRSVIVAVVVGYGLVWVIGSFVAPLCPACTIASESKPCARKADVIVGVVLAFHCVQDGIALSLAGPDRFTLPLALILHKFCEGFGLGVLLVSSRRSASSAFVFALVVECMTTLGFAFGRYPGLTRHPLELAVAAAFTAGGFLYVTACAVTGYPRGFVKGFRGAAWSREGRRSTP